MSDKQLKEICQLIVGRIRDDISTFAGHVLRADAGDAGMVYVALRNAGGDADVGASLAESLEPIVLAELDRAPRKFEFAVSMTTTGDDIVLQIEVRRR